MMQLIMRCVAGMARMDAEGSSEEDEDFDVVGAAKADAEAEAEAVAEDEAEDGSDMDSPQVALCRVLWTVCAEHGATTSGSIKPAADAVAEAEAVAAVSENAAEDALGLSELLQCRFCRPSRPRSPCQRPMGTPSRPTQRPSGPQKQQLRVRARARS